MERKVKKLIILALCVIVLIACAKKENVDNFISGEAEPAAIFVQSHFEIDESGKITKYVGQEKDVVIPEKIGIVVVTAIGDRAFVKKGLTSVILHDSITSIGSHAFSENQLTTINIPDNVTSIGTWAFSDNQLRSITGNISSLSNGEFGNNQLSSVIIPDKVISIPYEVFNKNQLTSVTFHDRVISIGSDAFSGNKLASITIPPSVTSIGSGAFAGNQMTSVTIPDSVVKIDYQAFYNNPLTRITLGADVSLGGRTPPGGDFAPSFTDDFDGYYNSGKKAGTYVYSEGRWKRTDNILENNFEINEEGIVTAYYGNDTVIAIPSQIGGVKVTEIGHRVFSKKGLTGVTMPEDVTHIGDDAFSNNKITDVIIPHGVTSIGSKAFFNNELTSITIPKSIVSLGRDSFHYNPLQSITIGNNVELFEPSMAADGYIVTIRLGFDGIYYYTGRKAGTYRFFFNENAEGFPTVISPYSWRRIGNIEENGFEIDEDGTIVVYNGQDISVIIPEKIGGVTVTSIGYGAFNGLIRYQKLLSVSIPDTVTSIGAEAFSSNLLENISIPKSVISIGDGAFSYNKLTDVTIPDSVISIGDNAFSNGNYRFSNNYLTRISIGADVIIDWYTFPDNFYKYYESNGKKAGAYVKSNDRWDIK